jgi:hypothetical protein
MKKIFSTPYLIKIFIYFIYFVYKIESSHFRGGTISWTPVDPSVTFPVASVQVQVTTRFFWNIAYGWSGCGTSCCNSAAAVAAGTTYGDGAGLISQSITPSWSLSTLAECYDFSTANSWSAQKRTQTQSMITSTKFTAMWTSNAWIAGVNNINNTGTWYMVVMFDLSQRADTGKINTSPVTSMVPYVIISANCANNRSVSIPVTDADGDIVRCRCNYNLCISNAVMDIDNCVLYFNPNVVGYYAIEVQIEDFSTASSTTPMSSVPLVFLVSVVNSGATCCADGTNDCRKFKIIFLRNTYEFIRKKQ